MGFFKKSESEKRLARARADMASKQSQLDALNVREASVLDDGPAYSKLRAERSVLVDEVDRLTKLIAALEAGEAAARQHDIDEAKRRRAEAARELQLRVSDRMRTDGVRLSSEVKLLLRDVSLAVLEAAAVNSDLPPGVPPIIDANALARGFLPVDRKEVSSELVDLWVFLETGEPVLRPDAVEEISPGVGELRAGRTSEPKPVARRQFRQITFHPAEPHGFPENLHTVFRFPFFDRPGIDFDGSATVVEYVAKLHVEAPKADPPRWRPMRTETVPVGPWSPPVLKPVGAVDDAES